jgi:glycosyltransferase involved in cell wall biosynthesis
MELELRTQRERRPTAAGLRVALVSETYPPDVNGVAHTLARLAEGLVDLGHRVTLVRPRPGSGSVPVVTAGPGESLQVIGVPLPFYREVRLGLVRPGRLVRLWRGQRPDVLYIATEGPLGWSALRAARHLGLPVVSGFHTNFDSYSAHYGAAWLLRPLRAYLRHWHNATTLTLVPTERQREALLTAGFARVEVLGRGVDGRLFHPMHRAPSLRAEWGVAADGPVVLHVGRLAPEKNLDLLVRAWRAMRACNPDARLVVVGDGPARAGLQAALPEAHFAGMRRGMDLVNHFASADLFLFPSLTETFGNVVLEAMASGLAIVAYDVAAAGVLLTDGVSGRLARAGDEAAFVAAACELARPGAPLARYRVAARQHAEGCAWPQVQRRFAALLAAAVTPLADGTGDVRGPVRAA